MFTGHPSAHVIVSVFVIPVLATILMEIAEGLVETLGWRVRLTKAGWDLCVLAVGSTGGIFTLPAVVRAWGMEGAALLGYGTLIVDVILGLLVIHIRKTVPERLTGFQSLFALACGGTALALPWYIVLHSY